MSDDQRIVSLEINRTRDAKRISEIEKWIDTVSSPLWKRVWFTIKGYRFRRLGRWYKASWNEDASAWD